MPAWSLAGNYSLHNLASDQHTPVLRKRPKTLKMRSGFLYWVMKYVGYPGTSTMCMISRKRIRASAQLIWPSLFAAQSRREATTDEELRARQSRAITQWMVRHRLLTINYFGRQRKRLFPTRTVDRMLNLPAFEKAHTDESVV